MSNQRGNRKEKKKDIFYFLSVGKVAIGRESYIDVFAIFQRGRLRSKIYCLGNFSFFSFSCEAGKVSV